MSNINIMDIQRFSLNDGPGIRTTVFFKGCGMFCKWCANPESQSFSRQLMYFEDKCLRCQTCVRVCPQGAVSFIDGKILFDREKCDCCGKCTESCMQDAISISGKLITAEAAAELALRDADYYMESGGGVTFSGGEPLLQPEGLKEMARLIKGNGVHTALETAANVPVDVFIDAIKDIDLILMDYKSADENKLLQYTGGNYERIKANMRAACIMGKEIIARIPVIPSFNFNEESMEGIFRAISEMGIAKADLLPYHVMGRKKYKSLNMEYPLAGFEKSVQKEELEIYRKLGESFNIQTTISGK